ncbi:lipopolysaccharide export system protein LptA [Devosia crocina]|uniref:Lipopolysaccharide export system protein LptA n=1 Tax=Devosia crocina TaxID=429728 RepID=A0A1I7NTC9_9HYPH|nr:LptA/OstA family protein [Devosia crocina]SFV37848.1 lipopolysaccharide export system protein LptA [Devosia crocina]
MKRLVPTLLFAALTLLPAHGQQQVEISADLFTIEEEARQALFTGQVVVKHPSVTVWASKVIASYGEGGTSDIRSFEATGTVKLETRDQTATGERAVFTPADQMLRLTGNVEVVNSGGTVRANELVVDMASGVSTFTAASGGRVTGVFTSQ